MSWAGIRSIHEIQTDVKYFIDNNPKNNKFIMLLMIGMGTKREVNILRKF